MEQLVESQVVVTHIVPHVIKEFQSDVSDDLLGPIKPLHDIHHAIVLSPEVTLLDPPPYCLDPIGYTEL